MRTHLTINFDRALVCFSNSFWFQNVGTVDDNHLLHGFKLPLVVDCVDHSWCAGEPCFWHKYLSCAAFPCVTYLCDLREVAWQERFSWIPRILTFAKVAAPVVKLLLPVAHFHPFPLFISLFFCRRCFLFLFSPGFRPIFIFQPLLYPFPPWTETKVMDAKS